MVAAGLLVDGLRDLLMAQLTPKERLQPSLLDRLTAPRSESGVSTISVEQLRESVRRELAALFSASALGAVDKRLEHYPHVQRSTINFGLPDLSGRTASSVNLAQLERQLTRAMQEFEPRVAGHSLRVRSISKGNNHNTLAFEIEGELWSQPLPQKLLLRTELDLESGQVRVEEARG